jgi:hypothetical protein
MVTNGLLRRTSRKTGASASRSCLSAGVVWHSIGSGSVTLAKPSAKVRYLRTADGCN